MSQSSVVTVEEQYQNPAPELAYLIILVFQTSVVTDAVLLTGNGIFPPFLFSHKAFSVTLNSE